MQHTVYHFASFSLDRANHQLTDQQQAVDIEPMVFQALLYLIDNRHTVVSKEQLFQHIWPGKVVTDNVISQTIYQIRRALNDDSKSAKYIRTVHGVGYQFIAPIETSAADQASSQLKGLSKQHYLLAVLLVIFAFVFFGRYAANQQQTDNTPAYQRVVLVPFIQQQNNADVSVLATGLHDYLYQQLTQINFHVSNGQPIDSLLTPETAEQMASHYRAHSIISGQIERQNQTVNVRLFLHQVQGEKSHAYSIGKFDLPYPNNATELRDFFVQRKKIISEIVFLLAPNLSIKPESVIETQSAKAYQMVMSAYQLQRLETCQEFRQAELLLNRAIEIDAKFAFAWRTLFANYYKRVWICGDSTDYYQKALDAALKVQQLAPGQYYVLAEGRFGILVETGQVEQGFDMVKNAHPNNPRELYWAAYALRYAGFLDEAKKRIDRVLQLDPFFFSGKPVAHSPNTLLYRNEFQHFERLLAHSDSPYHSYYRAFAALLNDQPKRAESLLAPIIAQVPEDLFGLFAQALNALVLNQPQQTVSFAQQIAEKRKDKRHLDGEVTYKQAQLFALAGEKQLALENLALAIEQGFFNVKYMRQDPALNSLHREPKYKQLLSVANLRHQSFAKRFDLIPET